MRWLRPIPEDWIPWHLTLFIALSMIGMVLRATEQLPLHRKGDIVGFTNTMIDGSVSVILVAATTSTMIVEGALIFAEKYLNYRYKKGREEGTESERQRWVDWMARKEAAEDAGEPFEEPSPAQTQASN